MNIIKLLKQPAPVAFERVKIIPAFLLGIFIFMFLFIFKPFGINELENLFFQSLGFGFVTFVTYIIYQSIWVLIFKYKFVEIKNVTLLSSILTITGLITLIACMNVLYSSIFIANFKLTLGSFLYFLISTFTIGLFPTIFFVYVGYVNELKKNTTALDTIQQNHIQQNSSEIITFTSNVGNDMISISSSNIICIMSQGNYVEINYFNESKTAKKIIRATLKEIETLLSKHKNFVKVHRSFIANTDLIEKSTGNSQGIQLFFKNTEIVVPVSRNYVVNFK
ncbi:MAG TPA: hypothetical protein DDX39_11790 [Bacteroidales bacterium]|nr:MAG: hypothetical protein A2W98_10165 [Bacteroidetes bacterium GWF2_33_38]OFY75128.1 MAG: hypothetical protein A2265_03170 [Bacteroidetes bacterium RIFOXYA12_FULL_33_9]HBF89313.1 hypothetical protein [Bacteroidales bacterium]